MALKRPCIGIRKETKDKTQQRVPLSPAQVRELVKRYGFRVLMQPMEARIFRDDEYRQVGAELTEDLSESNIILGVKEIDATYMQDGQAYCFFSHTLKGQSYNMPMLQYILDHNITLFDYELIKDAEGRRLVFFGNFAGYAGIIDSIWALGKRLEWEGIPTPFSEIRYTTFYGMLEDAEEALGIAGDRIEEEGLPDALVPFICGFTGYGNVSRGAQKIFHKLPVIKLKASELEAFMQEGEFSKHAVYKVEFRESDMFEPVDADAEFDLQEFYDHPDRYRAKFEQYLPHLTILLNGIYWEPRYPRLVTKEYNRELFAGADQPRLRVIGDVTCDIGGSIEMTVKETNSKNPVFVYEAETGAVLDGWEGKGPVILAVDKLPTELPREASAAFGSSLLPLVPALAVADLGVEFEALDLPDELKRAVIAHAGQLAPDYRYLSEYL